MADENKDENITKKKQKILPVNSIQHNDTVTLIKDKPISNTKNVRHQKMNQSTNVERKSSPTEMDKTQPQSKALPCSFQATNRKYSLVDVDGIWYKVGINDVIYNNDFLTSNSSMIISSIIYIRIYKTIKKISNYLIYPNVTLVSLKHMKVLHLH